MTEIFKKYPECSEQCEDHYANRKMSDTKEAITNLNGLFLTNINYNQAELDLKAAINLKQSYNQEK
jgi:hypothetical protein